MSILIKEKQCKGTGKAKDFEGCGTIQKFRKYGLGTKCGCFYKFFETHKPKQINKVSSKRKKEMIEYTKLRIAFLEVNRICFIEGCNKIADTIEHTAGRGVNYLNINTWKPCCIEHNLELETNTSLSRKYQKSKIHGGSKMIKQ